MSSSKSASSEAAWALLTEGVTASRLEVHRLRHLLNRALKLVEKSKRKDHLYQVAGDIIEDMPQRISRLETLLDRTSLALSGMGESYLSARLPLSEKQMVEEAISSSGRLRRSARRVAEAYLAREF